jgi:uncharacterized protein YqkB
MEKRGHLEKLKYDFNTSYSTEVEINGDFYRTTANEFRSWGGNRRILNVKDRTNPTYEKYFGPIYYFGSNKIVSQDQLTNQINYLPGYIRPERKKR